MLGSGNRPWLASLGVWAALASLANAETEAITKATAVIKRIGAEGKGNGEAKVAWRTLAEQKADAIPEILSTMKDAGPVAANWIRSSIDTIADRAIAQKQPLPTEALLAFLKDHKNEPRARRFAFELIARVDATAPDRLIPTMLDDPSVELRRDAVARVLDEADKLAKSDKSAAIAAYRKALSAARDEDQIKKAAKNLRDFKENVDLLTHFGFLSDWNVTGPFDNKGGKGFNVEYAPEKDQGKSKTYKADTGEVGWKAVRAKDEYGMVDLNRDFARHKGAVAYCITEFVSETEQPVEIRLGCKNAWKIWVNGEYLFGRDEYHRGMKLDQYRLKTTMKSGANVILVKICQNEQTDSWAQEWQFQLRVCDATGSAILSAKKADSKTGAGG